MMYSYYIYQSFERSAFNKEEESTFHSYSTAILPLKL